MDIAVHYNGNREKAEETARLYSEKEGVKTLLLQGNISEEQICCQLVNDTVNELGNIDVLVNNAGVTKDGLFIRMKEEDFDKVIDTNLKGAFFIGKYAANYMLKQRYGRIVNITSVVGIAGNAGQTNYSASKARIDRFDKIMCKRIRKKRSFSQCSCTGICRYGYDSKLADKVKGQFCNKSW